MYMAQILLEAGLLHMQRLFCAYPQKLRALATMADVHGFLTWFNDVCRPLTAAVAAAGRGTFTLDGVPRMRERPIQDLVDGLVQLGVSASCTMGTGCPPVTVEAQGLPSGTVCALLISILYWPCIPCAPAQGQWVAGR